MKEWQKELYIYRLSPAPPRKDDLQEYIDLYLAEKEKNICLGFCITMNQRSTLLLWVLFSDMRCSGISLT